MNSTPVVIINGFLGSGKTTLLRNLIVQNHERSHSISVIVNDMSQLDIDGVLIANTDIVGQDQNNFVTISGDSLSSSRGIKKMDKAINELLYNQQPELLIIETSGSSHPLPLIKYFSQQQHLRLTGVMVLADAIMLAQDYANGQTLMTELQENLLSNKRTATNLLAEQIMFSTHVLLTKTESLSDEKVQVIADAVHPFNPYVSIIAVSWGNLKLHDLFALPDYDFFRVEKLMDELEKEVEFETNSLSPYQMSSIVIKDDRPFHPQRLWDTYHQFLSEGIHRSKGFFWLPNRDKLALLWNQAANSIGLEYVSYWRSGILDDEHNNLTEHEKSVLSKMIKKQSGRFGDRRCRLTIIGDTSQLRRFADVLENCFLTEDEIADWTSGKVFSDPWPTNVVKNKR